MITLNRPLDMHLHLREGEMLKAVTPYTTRQFSGAVIMPNLIPPITSEERMEHYRQEIIASSTDESFKTLMTLFFQAYDKPFLESIKEKIFALKLYPAGITTNSEGGVKELEEMFPTIEIMQELGIPLLVHGETHGFVLDREREFVSVYEALAKTFPRLKITMEHVGTAELVDLIDKYENLHATVTLHHLLLTLDELGGGMLDVNYFCKPIIKTPKDRDAIQSVVKKAHQKVMFGSDSAPHPLKNKYKGAAGVFSAPVILPALAEFFGEDIENFQKFISSNAIENFALEIPEREIILREEEWIAPQAVGNVKPMWAGKTFNYRVEGMI